MLIELNRFLTRDEIERLYRMPPDVLPTVMAGVPVAHRGEDGQPYFVESDVDRAVDAFVASATGRQPPTSDPAPNGKPGRRNTTADIALLVNDLKAQRKTWKEILAACKSRFLAESRALSKCGRSGDGALGARSSGEEMSGEMILPNFSPSQEADTIAAEG